MKNVNNQSFPWEKLIPEEALQEEGNTILHDIKKYGVFETKNRYYIIKKLASGFQLQSISNFTFRIVENAENLKTIQLKNFRNQTATLRISTDDLQNLRKFQERSEAAGNYIYLYKKSHHAGLLQKVFDEFFATSPSQSL